MSVETYAVLPVHNRRETTFQCLESLADVRQNGFRLHVVVVDDGSTDGTREAIRTRFSSVTLLEGDGSLWWPGAINVGVRRGLNDGADYILFLNDDTVHDPAFLEHLVATAQHYPRSVVGAMLLQMENPEQTFQCPATRWPLRGWDVLPSQPISSVPERPWAVGFLPGNCVLYPREVFEEVGLVDEDHFPHFGADAEMSVRARKAGWRLLVDPRARVWNGPNPVETAKAWTFKESVRQYLIDRRRPRNVITRGRLFWRTAPSMPLAMVAIGMMFLEIVVQLPGWVKYRTRTDGRLPHAPEQ